MKKIKKLKSKTFLYHCLSWSGIYLLWVLVFRSHSFTLSKTMTVEFCYLVFITADFYAINYFAVPQLLFKRKPVLFAGAALLTIAVSAWLRALVAVEMNRHVFNAAPARFGNLYSNSAVNISLWVLAVTLAKMLIGSLQTRQQLDLLEKERIRAELDYLKAQINPHALLNSLNTIYGHIDKNNQTARDTLLQFSELLKYQLYECSEEKVALEKEVGYLRNYIAFQRLRKADGLPVLFDAADIGPGLEIAPLLLVVPIENAFKFVGSSPGRENGICIRLSTRENILHCSISNTRAPRQSMTAAGPNGIGMANLKRRLALLYPQQHALDIHDEADFYQTNLTINLA